MINNCPQCEILANDFTIRGACASVGIEKGKTTDQMVAEYIKYKHREH